MDEIVGAVGKSLSLFAHYPDVTALILGTLIGYVLVLMIETYFLPVETDPVKIRKQKGLTFILCWVFSGGASAILWRFLDPSDKPGERLIVSYLVGVLSFAAYPLIGRIITRFIPSVGSAWSPRAGPPA